MVSGRNSRNSCYLIGCGSGRFQFEKNAHIISHWFCFIFKWEKRPTENKIIDKSNIIYSDARCSLYFTYFNRNLTNLIFTQAKFCDQLEKYNKQVISMQTVNHHIYSMQTVNHHITSSMQTVNHQITSSMQTFNHHITSMKLLITIWHITNM